MSFITSAFSDANHSVLVGEITPAGAVTEFAVPDPAGQFFNNPAGIAAGPDGDVWFGWAGPIGSGQVQSFIGQMTPAGAFHFFPVSPIGVNDLISSLAAGVDGNLWFTGDFSSKSNDSVLGRMTPSDVVTLFPIPGHIGEAWVANGPMAA